MHDERVVFKGGRFRRFPPVCLLVAAVLVLLGHLQFRRRYR